MKRVAFIGLATLVVGMMAGCSGGSIGDVSTVPEQPEESDPGSAEALASLIIEDRTDVHTVGRIHTADGDFTFSATTSKEGRLSVAFNINGKRFDALVDGATTVIDGHDAVLTEADKTLLRTFAQAFDTKLAGITTYRHDSAIYSWAAFLAIAPNNYVHKRIENVEEPEVLAAGTTRVFGNEGTKCIAKGTVWTADYTARPMAWGGKVDAGAGTFSLDGGINYISEPVLVGSNWGKVKPRTGATTWSTSATSDYNCMGKCGGACSSLGGGYTKDCLDHDTCSYRYMSYGGGNDTYCGDEYSQASEELFNSCPK